MIKSPTSSKGFICKGESESKKERKILSHGSFPNACNSWNWASWSQELVTSSTWVAQTPSLSHHCCLSWVCINENAKVRGQSSGTQVKDIHIWWDKLEFQCHLCSFLCRPFHCQVILHMSEFHILEKMSYSVERCANPSYFIFLLKSF